MGPRRIVERKVRLDGETQEFVCEPLLVEPHRRAVLSYVLDRDWDVAGLMTLPRGTLTIAHYWADRPYNVYHWIRDGATLAYYVNIAAPAEIAPDLVSYRDLAVDVLLRPNGAIDVIDEEDIPSDLPPADRKVIADALETVITSGRRLAAEVETESRRLVSPGSPPAR